VKKCFLEPAKAAKPAKPATSYVVAAGFAGFAALEKHFFFTGQQGRRE